ncbi:hypothetical protein [Nocardia sp. NPDC050413]|uniref:hypothetical protein n=1 Tax=Nocardia sp. NPDC050413 TaxID=3155784 RepID=UPI0033C79EC8
MAVPNPLPDPEEHGEDLLGGLTPAQQAQLSALDEDMDGSPAAKLAAQLVPVKHDGGQFGRTAKPVVDRAARARDWARIWGPAVAGTGVAVAAVTVLPLPGPLSLYVLAVAAFGWWHCAGRPGITETAQMVGYAIADTGSWIRRHVEALAVRRARYETRRTTSDPKPKQS